MALTKTDNRKLNLLIKQKVIEYLQELLEDPDYGMIFRKTFLRRLRKSIQSKKAKRIIPLEKVLERYN